MSSKKIRARAESVEAQTAETTVADVEQTAEGSTTEPAPPTRTCSFCEREPFVLGAILDGLTLAACEDGEHRARLRVLTDFDASRREVPPFTELVATSLQSHDSDAATLSALCAAQMQHSSPLTERAIRTLSERLAAKALVPS